jgi:hypothetical protein
MKRRSLQLRIAGLSADLALALAVTLAPMASQGGIFRDVLSSVGLAKPSPPPPGTPTLPFKGFACCNLHYDGDWISDDNYAALPMIPAGTPIEVLSWGRNRAAVTVDGKAMRLGHDAGRDQEPLETWVAKIVVSEDPRPRIGAYPPAVRDAIFEGKVLVGMTREQAIVSIGYPPTNENVSLDGPIWRVWHAKGEGYQLNFRPDGHLKSVTGEDSVTTLVTYRPEH